MRPTPSKPYLKWSRNLLLFGTALFALERFGLGKLEGPDHGVHLDSTILSILVAAPILLILAAVIVFMVGKMRRL